MKWRVFTDFDGTLTEQDTLVLLLDHFGRKLPSGHDWRVIEFDPDLPEEIKLRRELELLDCTLEEALSYLDKVSRLRPGIQDLLDWLEKQDEVLHVLSGGVGAIIRHTLSAFNSSLLRIEANEVHLNAKGWTVIPNPAPRIRERCNHCKTSHLRVARAEGCQSVYIGDGSTDFCPAREADLVFARDSLASQLASENRPFQHFSDFHEVLESIKRQVKNS